jgi:hypothetical protein
MKVPVPDPLIQNEIIVLSKKVRQFLKNERLIASKQEGLHLSFLASVFKDHL